LQSVGFSLLLPNPLIIGDKAHLIQCSNPLQASVQIARSKNPSMQGFNAQKNLWKYTFSSTILISLWLARTSY
ncbi:hypothetical protein ACJX0J_006353, partial [Zea mays]